MRRKRYVEYREFMNPIGRLTGWWMHHVKRRSRLMDETRRSKHLLYPWIPRDVERWKRYHNRYDMIGVDDPVTNPRRIIRETLRQYRKSKQLKQLFRDFGGAANSAFHMAVKNAKLLFRGINLKPGVATLSQQLRDDRFEGGKRFSSRVVSTSIDPKVAFDFSHTVNRHIIPGHVFAIDKRELAKHAKFFPLEYVYGGGSEDGVQYPLTFSNELEVRVEKKIPRDAVGVVYSSQLKDWVREVKRNKLKLIPLPIEVLKKLFNIK